MNVKCPLCNSFSEKTEKVFSLNMSAYYSLFECPSCSLGFIHPLPSEEELTTYYNSRYEIPLTEYKEKAIKTVRRRAASVKRFIQPEDRILEIGCAYGFFLDRLKKEGFPFVNGVEISEKYVHYAQNFLGLSVKEGSFTSGNNKKRDVVFMWHVLEHIRDPLHLMKEIHRSLTEEGLCIFEIPNFNSLGRKMSGKY
ncbi:hypothetical protein COY95_01900 [Candidatus Woesearchaeota archaeon CG_4_10_14_0_8_um_filter_47_5]|nr:MAG: hypothetical protein COY95_01900 [Candidatus Woesearchaeota archaeon CG_4_10_14_0_8_um_filter_47_5]